MFARRITLALWAFSSFVAAGAQTQASGPAPSRQWRKAAELPPGTEILVREQGRRVPRACVLVWIDNHALACDSFAESTPRRLVYPAASVASVVEAPSPDDSHADTHVSATLIAVGAGALLGGLAAKDSGAQAGAAGALLGGALGGGIAAAAGSEGFARPPQPQWSIRLPVARRAPHLHRF